MTFVIFTIIIVLILRHVIAHLETQSNLGHEWNRTLPYPYWNTPEWIVGGINQKRSLSSGMPFGISCKTIFFKSYGLRGMMWR